ncbi:MAG: ornithine carbamoyltransferase [Gemmatimonadetes bacterium]|nr:ornithine carbamoyltransferase [Gemmatimonadota bacterium]
MAKRDFLSLADLSRDEFEMLVKRAIEGKKEWKEGRAKTPMKGKVLGLIFHKPSLRTRVSFEVGARQLGGSAIYLTDKELGIGSREAVEDVGEVLSRYLDVIMIRTFDHKIAVDLAANAKAPVINGLTDLFHPCQVLADVQTIVEHRDTIEGKVVTFYGDGSNNMAHSWINAAAVLPFELRIATPSNYLPDAAVMSHAKKCGAKIVVSHDAKEVSRGADVLYTDVWASMGQESERDARIREMMPYQINAEALALAKKDALVLHCLPAHRGEEVTADVIDGPHSVIYDEAENRLHAQKAIIEWLLA